MALHDTPHDGQADAGAFIDVARVQALERGKNALGVTALEADAVVGYAQFPARGARGVGIFDPGGGDVDVAGAVGGAEFQRIGQQVLQQLAHLGRVGLDHRQRIHLDRGLRLGDARLQVVHDGAQGARKVDGADRHGACGHAGIGQQVVDQRLHAMSRVGHALQVVAG